MKYKRIKNKIIVRIDRGEEVVQKLTELCKKEDIKLGSITGIGATNNAEIGYFETETKEYHKKTLTGDLEIAPLTGNITTMNGQLYLHLHINLGDKDQKAYAGHLSKAVISATFEGIIDIIDGEIDRYEDEDIGLNLLKFK